MTMTSILGHRNPKRTKADDISDISDVLKGKIEFSYIKFDQVLTKEHGESVNDLFFIDKKFGLWFYTSRSAIDNICYLIADKFPTYVVCEGSKNVYEIKK